MTGAFVLSGCIALAVLGARRHADVASGIGLRVEGAELQADGAVEATGLARPVLRFSDGSEISLADGARARVRSTDEHGARVTLERGEAHIYVVHGQGAHWTFDAGPFVVAVTGTAFSLAWREDSQRFDLRLENGAVIVSGPASDAPIALRAGQWLTAQGGEVRIRSLDATNDGETAAPHASPSQPPVPASSSAAEEIPTTSQGAATLPPLAHERNWASEVARGRSEAIVAEAIARGIDRVFAQSSGDELAALADAARYTHRQDIARGACLAERRRFPGSNYARVAAFDLGRVEDTGQDAHAALGWFDTYLAEAPDGPFASEALGRKMTLVKLLRGKEAAQSWAELYLRRFPNGTYASAARAVTGIP
jgi:TolA-binding protein